MNRKIIFGILFTLLLIGMLTLAFNIQQVKSEPKTWTVDDDGPADFHTIQDAIDSPEVMDEDIIFVHEGTYYENVVVNKAVSLIGENKDTTLIDGNGTGTVVYVTANNVTISGFTVQKCGIIWDGFIFPEYGFRLRGHNCNITGNTIANNGGTGIFVERSDDNVIRENIIVNNTGSIGDYRWGGPAYGIDLDGDNCIISNNVIANNSGGVFLIGDNNVVEGNLIINNTHELTRPPPYYPPFRELCLGINIASAKNSIIDGNVVNGNDCGIFLVLDHSYAVGNVLRNNSMSANRFNFGIHEHMNPQQDIDFSNTVNGKPICYWVDQHSKHVPSDAGYVALINCTDITVKNLNLTNNFQGIFVYNMINFTIDECIVTDNRDYGVGLWESENCIIRDNTITNNNGTEYGGYGVGIRGWYSEEIYITNNTIANNQAGITSLWRNWTISGNKIANNNRGIVDSMSTTYGNNVIFHNNFINNTRQVYVPPWGSPSINVWDDGYPSGGNYWSDYEERYPNATEMDGSGIWDTPYVIDADNQDNYPLMEPYSPLPRTIDELKSEIEELGSEGEIDNQGIVKSLLAKLDAAQKLIDAGKMKQAKNILNAFINEVQAQSGKHVTPEAAEILMESAEYIISNL